MALSGQWCHFWKSCFFWAFLRWRDGEGYIAILISFLSLASSVGVIASFVQRFPNNWWTWLSLIIFTVLFFIIAPYQVWKLEYNRANEAEEKLKPKVFLELGIVDHEKKLYHLRVKNSGAESLKKCTGFLRRVFSEAEGHYHQHDEVSYRQLKWSERYESGPGLTFNIDSEAELLLAYELLDSFVDGRVHFYPDDAWTTVPCILEVRVAAENSASVTQFFYLSLNPFEFRRADDFIVPPAYRVEGQ